MTMSEETARAENYNAQNLLDTINQTRTFLWGELSASQAINNDRKQAAVLRLAISKAIEALAPKRGG